jgi:hypothetical protein
MAKKDAGFKWLQAITIRQNCTIDNNDFTVEIFSCLELDTGYITICKPLSLSLTSQFLHIIATAVVETSIF